ISGAPIRVLFVRACIRGPHVVRLLADAGCHLVSDNEHVHRDVNAENGHDEEQLSAENGFTWIELIDDAQTLEGVKEYGKPEHNVIGDQGKRERGNEDKGEAGNKRSEKQNISGSVFLPGFDGFVFDGVLDVPQRLSARLPARAALLGT